MGIRRRTIDRFEEVSFRESNALVLTTNIEYTNVNIVPKTQNINRNFPEAKNTNQKEEAQLLLMNRASFGFIFGKLEWLGYNLAKVVWAQHINVTDTQTATSPWKTPRQRRMRREAKPSKLCFCRPLL